jgi:hypothetical protein
MILEDIQNTGWSYNFARTWVIGLSCLNGQEQPSACMTTPITWQENLVLAIVPADGQLLSSYLTTSLSQYLKAQGGDVFPGTSNITALNDTMNLPNFVWYNMWILQQER